MFGQQYRLSGTIFVLALATASAAGVVADAQDFVHAPTSLSASDFESPPDEVMDRSVGPAIAAARNAKCWHAEPQDPDTFIGGSAELQKVEIFLPFSVSEGRDLDTNFHQSTTQTLAGGGSQTSLKPEDIPAGISVSVNGHPIYAVTSISYPVTDPLALFTGRREKGVLLEVEFMHQPRMGECYLFAAAWLVMKP